MNFARGNLKNETLVRMCNSFIEFCLDQMSIGIYKIAGLEKFFLYNLPKRFDQWDENLRCDFEMYESSNRRNIDKIVTI